MNYNESQLTTEFHGKISLGSAALDKTEGSPVQDQSLLCSGRPLRQIVL
jgi:hypothetical protein